MGVEVFPVLENQSEEWAEFGSSGHWFGRVILSLDKIAKKGKVRPLFDFYCLTREQSIFELNSDPEDPSTFNEKELPEEVWFNVDEALETVQFYIQHIKKDQKAFDDTDEILKDLNEFERILGEAKSRKVRWHLGQSA
jgi:hypothetical protein